MVKRICFMVMPYDTKPTAVEPGMGPERVDFNALWLDVFRPAIEKLGYQAVRADIDLGPLIITEMIQRLAISDLVIADISIANANVYYEIGVRHAARETGCVLVSADWAKPVFDLAQIRAIRYPLPVPKLDAAAAAELSDRLAEDIRSRIEGRSPIFDAVPGYPQPDLSRAQAFTDLLAKLAACQSQIAATQTMPRGEARANRALALRDQYMQTEPISPSVAIEILYMLRDSTDFATTAAYIDTLPKDLRELPVVREQRALAMSKTGDHLEAIAALHELIALRGETSERAGLVGGRYKRLYREALAARKTSEAAPWLDHAIDWYRRGMMADLNDFYPMSNLPRLLRERGNPGDEEEARMVAAATRAACERTLRREPNHPWVRQTLLGQAVDARDLDTVKRLAAEVSRTASPAWHLDTTDADLRASIAQIADGQQKAAFEAAIASLAPPGERAAG